MPTPEDEKPTAPTSDGPKVKLLQDALRDAGLEPKKSLLIKMRQTAKQLNACYRIGRQFYVSNDQLAQILEAYRWQLGNPSGQVADMWLGRNRKTPPSKDDHLTLAERQRRLLAQIEKAEQERKKKERGPR